MHYRFVFYSVFVTVIQGVPINTGLFSKTCCFLNCCDKNKKENATYNHFRRRIKWNKKQWFTRSTYTAWRLRDARRQKSVTINKVAALQKQFEVTGTTSRPTWQTHLSWSLEDGHISLHPNSHPTDLQFVYKRYMNLNKTPLQRACAKACYHHQQQQHFMGITTTDRHKSCRHARVETKRKSAVRVGEGRIEVLRCGVKMKKTFCPCCYTVLVDISLPFIEIGLHCHAHQH